MPNSEFSAVGVCVYITVIMGKGQISRNFVAYLFGIGVF